MSDAGADAEGPVFVVQRHDATALHYDLRLEVDGVLVSWAVPRTPSLDPGVRRLARRVGDHDLTHADFEGVAGSSTRHTNAVIVWDTGRFEDRTVRGGAPVGSDAAIEAGHVVVRLHGQRLRGDFALTRTAMGGDASNWLLVKVDDEHADRTADLSVDETSVLTGRTTDDVAREESPQPTLPDA